MSTAKVIRMRYDAYRRDEDRRREEEDRRRQEDADRRRQEDADWRREDADRFAILIATLRPQAEVTPCLVNPGFCLMPDMSAAIPNFTGEYDQLHVAEEWLQSIESTGNCYNWPDLVKLEMASTHLIGAARAWYLNRYEDLIDWERFVGWHSEPHS